MIVSSGFIPHTDDEIGEMLSFMGLKSLNELFEMVPESIRLARDLQLDIGRGEADVLDEMGSYAANNFSTQDLICFAGGGAYDHDIPSAVRALAGRSEFVTAYTPYQPEVSQGVLQALFEFQTIITRLTGLPISNASLYDGASALVEAINLSAVATKRDVIWMSQGVHPNWRQVARTFSKGTGRLIREIPLVRGATRWPGGDDHPGEPPAAIVVAYPNYLGCIEDIERASQLAKATGALLILAIDPVSAGVLRSAGEFGADVAIGEGQVFGTALGFGGPYLGLFTCSMEHLRRLPGRLVGETSDTHGRRAYVTTLRAREQDIRREKASSNVCTNQTLMAITAAIQLAWLGTKGLRSLAVRCAQGTRYCQERLLAIDGVEPLTDLPTFREFALRAPVPATVLIDRLSEDGFLGGIALGPELDESGCEGGLLISVTEKRTASQIDGFADVFAKAIR
ncbi:MAG TPA: aminomethyl-transferring glycine dehydrogenase subunit GcvPA [Acidimicrobiales bacterium]|nr:aminomethyl-transferring glycine dehydrogenase subunit GcvPA [Acidimicrobiales bacterium]